MKKHPWILSTVAALALGATLLMQAGCSKPDAEPKPTESAKPAEGTKQVAKYTCSMHPEIVQDKPGKCPTCGMALVEKK